MLVSTTGMAEDPRHTGPARDAIQRRSEAGGDDTKVRNGTKTTDRTRVWIWGLRSVGRDVDFDGSTIEMPHQRRMDG